MANAKFDWAKMKCEYILGNLKVNGSLPLRDLAKKYGAAEGTVWNKARAEYWNDEVVTERAKRDTELITEVKEEVLAEDKQDLLEEYRVRVENFKVATNVLGPLVTAWNNKLKQDPKYLEKLSPKEIVMMLDTVLRARKSAAGLPDTFKFISAHINLQEGERSVEHSIQAAKKRGNILANLLTYVESKQLINAN